MNRVSVQHWEREIVAHVLADGTQIPCEPVTVQIVEVRFNGELTSSHLFWTPAEAAVRMQEIKQMIEAHPTAVRAIFPDN